MHTLVHDIRYSLRLLCKTPAVSLIAVLSLALGIGGNSAMFSVTQAVLLRPPAFKDLDRLVMLWGTSRERGQGRSLIAGADLMDWRKQSRVFDALELCDSGASPSTVTAGGIPERIRREYVSSNLFQALRVQPVLGRSFSEEEIRRGARTVVLSYEFWVRRFGADQNVLGSNLILNGNPATIIGVMPRQFGILSDDTDLWEPLDAPGTDDMTRKIQWLVGIGRLKPGVTLAAAQIELSGIARQLAQEYPETNKDRGVLLDPLATALTQGLKGFLMPLFGAVGFVLVIGCANVANLLLARATARRREMVIRAALGAGRLRIVSQLLTESVILAAISGLVGLVVAFWGIKLFQILAPVWFPKVGGIALNWSVTGFTLALSLATGILAGITPAIHASRPDLNECLKQASRGSGGARARTRTVLVVAEIALAFVLLIGAGLMVNSLVRLLHVNPGFDPRKLLTMQIDLSGPRYIQPVELRNDLEIFTITPRVESFYKSVLG
jgi:putative ABC transport system permease protein